MAATGQAGTKAAKSRQTTGSMYICDSPGPPCMQSTGHTSTQASSFAPMQGSQITYVKLYTPSYFLAYQSALICVKCRHCSGRSSSVKIACTGQAGSHAPQS